MANDPSHFEDEYFAREEIEKLYKLAKEVEARQKKEEADALRTAHHMCCPKCGNTLTTVNFRDMHVDRCFHCHGTWLDEGELAKLVQPEAKHSLLNSVVNIFSKRG